MSVKWVRTELSHPSLNQYSLIRGSAESFDKWSNSKHSPGFPLVFCSNCKKIFVLYMSVSPNGPVYLRSQSQSHCTRRSGRLWTPPTTEGEELEGSNGWRSEPNYHPLTYCFQENEIHQTQSKDTLPPSRLTCESLWSYSYVNWFEQHIKKN